MTPVGHARLGAMVSREAPHTINLGLAGLVREIHLMHSLPSVSSPNFSGCIGHRSNLAYHSMVRHWVDYDGCYLDLCPF